MAWIRWRGRGAAKRGHVGYRDPATREVVYDPEYRSADPSIAEAMRVEVERTLERKRARGSKSTARVAYEAWLRSLKERGRTEDTIRYYRGRLAPLIAELGDLPVAKLRASHVEEYVARERKPPARELGASSRLGVLKAYGTWLAWCAEQRLPVAAAVVEDVGRVERPRVRASDRIALTPVQIGAMIDAAKGTPLEAAVGLAGLAGLPLGDIRTLRWDEVDLEGMTVLRRHGRRKTGTTYRVAISGRVAAILKALPRAGPLVAPVGKGGDVGRLMRAIYARANVPREKGDAWHRLRHGFLTGLSAAGADVATVARAAGHVPGSSVTLRYIHTDAERVRAAVDALDAETRSSDAASIANDAGRAR